MGRHEDTLALIRTSVERGEVPYEVLATVQWIVDRNELMENVLRSNAIMLPEQWSWEQPIPASIVEVPEAHVSYTRRRHTRVTRWKLKSFKCDRCGAMATGYFHPSGKRRFCLDCRPSEAESIPVQEARQIQKIRRASRGS